MLTTPELLARLYSMRNSIAAFHARPEEVIDMIGDLIAEIEER